MKTRKTHPTASHLEKFWMFLYGAEGEGGDGGSEGGEGTGQEPPTPPESGSESDDLESDDDDDDEEDKVPESARKLRRENQKLRKERNELRAEKEKRDREKMSEVEKAQADAKAEKERNDQIMNELDEERFRAAVLTAAASANFNDPADALAHISKDDLEKDDSGRYTEKSAKSAIKTLAKDKAYLVKTFSGSGGSGDGGSRGGSADQQAAKIQAVESDFASKGAIKRTG